jgi:Cu(I)/Ag(I) efflux system membrane fusion protein
MQRHGRLLGFSAVAVVAFSLGMLFSGGNGVSKTNGAENHAHDLVPSSEPMLWTCSMHPQIQLLRPGKCPICSMDLIPLETTMEDELGPRQLRLSETAKALARIETTPAVRAFAKAEVRLVGKLAFDETRLSYITAWVPGRLDRLFADFTGMTVKKGEHMVEMYSPELVAAQEELQQAKAAVDVLDRSASSVLKSTAAATVEAAREKLRLLGLTDSQIQTIESSGEVSDRLTLYAPTGGIVVHKDAQEGMYVDTGTRIYTLADLSKLWVLFEAYESDLPWLRYAQPVTFTSPSFPGENFEALVSFIDPVVDPTTRTVQVRAVVENEDLRLKPDMFVRGVVESRVDSDGNVIHEDLTGKWICPMHPEVVKSGPGACDECGMDLVRTTSLGYAGAAPSKQEAPLLIPAGAPLITGKRAVVYMEVSDEDGPLFEGREIELGPRAGDFYVVRSGIQEGERVVTNGAFKIDSELQIQAKPSMMLPHGGEGAAAHEHEVGVAEASESLESLRALTPVYEAYFDLQRSLAADDLERAKNLAEELRARIDSVDMKLFSPTGHTVWMRLARRLSDEAARISEGEDIASARDAFYGLAAAVIELENAFGHADGRNYYLTFCPMARNNQGADWLQDVDKIFNPFFGSSMLRCGEIKKTLQPATVTKDD